MPTYPLTKIVATVGPATSSRDQLVALIDAGTSVIRLNFSHGAHTDHRAVFNNVRSISAAIGRPIAILQDLQGPKLRIGDLVDGGPVALEDGGVFRICTQPTAGTAERASTSYPDLARDVQVGDRIMLDDGNLELRVTALDMHPEHGDEIVCEVIHGGLLYPHKGINLPGTTISSPSLTEKDLADLRFGIDLGVDIIALSFVRSPDDIVHAQAVIASMGGSQPLIAKIEKPQAVTYLAEIVAVADGVMVARGDLGVEMSPEAVPLIQKQLIKLANATGKPVITATQMLESMIDSPRPTRAEVSDVANAVLDGSDAVMLSGETAVGAYPVDAVKIMGRIARTVENGTPRESSIAWRSSLASPVSSTPTDAIAAARAATSLAEAINARAIAVLTETGVTAKHVSRERPGVPILALTEHDRVANQLALWHGIVPSVDPLDDTVEGLVTRVDERVRQLDLASTGDTIVIVGVVPRLTGQSAVFVQIHHLMNTDFG